MNPYLQMLLKRRQPIMDIPRQPMDERLPGGRPAIDISQRLPPPQPQMMGAPVPVPAATGVPAPISTPTIAVKPRSRVDEAADTVRKYESGLHIDPKTGEWVPYHRNKARQILEGVGTVAAGMVGIPLQKILHPRGTPEQQARARLGTEIGLEKEQTAKRAADANIALDEQQTIALKNRGPAAEAEAKKKAARAALEESLKLHPQPFDPQDPDDQALLEQAKQAGIIINPRTAGKQPAGQAGFSLNPGEARYDAKGNLIVERPGVDKPSTEEPDIRPQLAELESGFRSNAEQARQAADAAEAKAKTYIAQQTFAQGADYDPDKDPNAASMVAEVKRQREFAADQLRRADETAAKKAAAVPKVKKSGGDPKVQSYADEFFGGDYKAAEAAIKKQRGQ